MNIHKILAITSLALVAVPGLSFADDADTAATARDELQLDSTAVTGNRELPRVMAIVPWKRSGPGSLAGRPLNTLLEEVLSPVDRQVFVRQLKFYDGLRAERTGNTTP